MSDNNPNQNNDQADIDKANKNSQDWIEKSLYPLGKHLIRFAPLGGKWFYSYFVCITKRLG